MTYLRGFTTEDTELIVVDMPLVNPTYPLFYDLDGETIKVVDGADTTSWQVERGAADTIAAVHIAGIPLVLVTAPFGAGGSISITDGTTTVDPATSLHLPPGTLSAPGGGVAGVKMLLQVLGPWTFGFDTVPGKAGTGYMQFYFDQLPNDAFLLDVLLYQTQPWAGSDANTIEFLIGPYDVANDQLDFVSRFINFPTSSVGPMYNSDTGNLYWREFLPSGFGFHLTKGVDQYTFGPARYLVGTHRDQFFAGVKIAAEVDYGGSAPTAGQSGFYAIIATPAA